MAERGHQETITVVFGEEQFSPMPYNTFRFGPFTYTTNVREEETPEQALERAWNYLEAFARKVYLKKRAQFMERHEGREG